MVTRPAGKSLGANGAGIPHGQTIGAGIVGSFTVEMLVIAVVRVLGSLPVLRWPFAGAVIAVLVDLSDLFLVNLLDLGGVNDYQRFDKYLDQVYMLTFLLVALRWQGMPRTIAAGLYAFRLAGVLVFELTGARGVLPWFPNVFEFWVLFVAALHHWRLTFAYERRAVAIWLVVLTALKVLQEYVIHGARLLDSFTAVEAVQAIWRWLTAPLP